MSKIGKKEISDFMHWLGLFTAPTFIALGIFILTTENLNGLEKSARVLFAVFFLALGVFRVVNWVLKNKSRKYDNQREDDDNNNSRHH